MSRIGKKPIPIPKGVTVKIEGQNITVKGPKGELSRTIHPLASAELDGDNLVVKRANDSRYCRAIHGLTRSLLNNMVVGVSQGFKKELLVVGIGYKVDAQGNTLKLNIGFSHPIEFPLPKGITAKVERQKDIKITLEGIDKELLGLTAARIRALRPPEPYKGKGIRYVDEEIIRKAGKAAAKK